MQEKNRQAQARFRERQKAKQTETERRMADLEKAVVRLQVCDTMYRELVSKCTDVHPRYENQLAHPTTCVRVYHHAMTGSSLAAGTRRARGQNGRAGTLPADRQGAAAVQRAVPQHQRKPALKGVTSNIHSALSQA